ncbi:MAG TPA: HAMP domain-containing sensor histidine kinase [Stellaceae bacterium]|nr:HAMP domain-containing sensor histidine kinase [Stellaceae bacterium]
MREFLERVNPIYLHGALVLGMAAAFVLDLLTPPGVADGIAYPVLLALCVLVRSRRALLVYSALATVLTLIPAFVPQGGVGEIVLINRAIAIGSIWIIAFLIRGQLALDHRLRAQEQEARDASRAKSHFLANISHELRTPLNAIIGFSDFIAASGPQQIGEKKFREYIGDIHASGLHLLALINDLLDIAKIEAGKYRIAEEQVIVAQIVDEAVRLVAATAHQSGLVIEATLEESLPLLSADRRAVKQVLLNVLSNAVKFTPSGGRIRLEARLIPDGLCISISDTGIGISAADLARLGRPFEQAQGSAGGTKRGAGLGLALSRTFMELHGGVLQIESQLGRGTTVRLRFPPARVVAPGTAPQPGVARLATALRSAAE